LSFLTHFSLQLLNYPRPFREIFHQNIPDV